MKAKNSIVPVLKVSIDNLNSDGEKLFTPMRVPHPFLTYFENG